MLTYKVKVKLIGRDAALDPDLRFANGRYDWVGPKVNDWVTVCYQQFGVMLDERWTEVQRAGASERVAWKSA